MFLGFANFYRRFIKVFSQIVALLTSISKTTAPSVPTRPVRSRADENEFGTDDGGGIGSGRIDDRLANHSNSIKKMSFGLRFLTTKLA